MKIFALFFFLASLISGKTRAQEAASKENSNEQLVGVWKGKERYGPDARGSLIIRKQGNTWLADMMGLTIPVKVNGNVLSFELPGRQGTFRGRQVGTRITGHWRQPGTISNGFGFPMVSATPVALVPSGPDQWMGSVEPSPDEATIYLLVDKKADGTLSVLMRNPERDFGNQMRIDRLVRDGNKVRLLGTRGQNQNQEWASGVVDPDGDYMTLFFPSRALNLVMLRDDDYSNAYSRGKKPARYAYRVPPSVGDGWGTGRLDDVGIDRAGMEKVIQAIIDTPEDAPNTPQTHGIIVIRHGRLVLEEYFHGFTREMLHTTRSASKSMTATIIGAAIQAGAPIKPSSSVYRVINGGVMPAGLESRKQNMTLENLLTMSSGIFCDDNNDNAPGQEDRIWEQTAEPNFYRLYMSLPLDRVPGQKSVYCSNDPNLALAMLEHATGEDPLRTFDRLLAEPMKIHRYSWTLDRAGNAYGGGGAAFTLRDFAKFGQLMLDSGMWNGRRILSRDWVKRATSPLTAIGTRKYGYLWWLGTYPYGGKELDVIWALGAGGQNITIIPQLDLVIAVFSGSFNTRAYGYATGELIPKLILPTVQKKVR